MIRSALVALGLIIGTIGFITTATATLKEARPEVPSLMERCKESQLNNACGILHLDMTLTNEEQ